MIMRKFMLLTAFCFGAIEIVAAASPALAQTNQKPPPHKTYVPAQQTATGNLKAAAQSPAKAAGTFDGRRGSASTTVQVKTSTSTVNAAAYAAQQNAAEKARRAQTGRQTSQKYGIDKIHVP
jgi:hypothetical protein